MSIIRNNFPELNEMANSKIYSRMTMPTYCIRQAKTD